jgi:two-component system, chemotaxis family, protein-glutamate methylesterase/glutaminase
MPDKIKVVVVDDSAFMRKLLSVTLTEAGDIEVVGIGRDGEEGYNLVKTLKPDIVTLDVQMPKVDGLAALKRIMADCPTPAIMFSSLTTEGAEETLKAFEYGALDFVAKDGSITGGVSAIKEELVRKVREITKQKRLQKSLSRLRTLEANKSAPAKKIVPLKSLPRLAYKAIAIGISTGGPMALQKILPEFSEKINCPIFIVQHMPPRFTKSLADRLNGLCSLTVKEAENNELVKNKVIYIAPGGFHMTVCNAIEGPRIQISEMPDNYPHKPSVDVMLLSLTKYYGNKLLGVIMTGMGKEGLEGIKDLKSKGGYCLVQDESTCVVYGMPKAIMDAGLADLEAPIEKIPEIINKALI